MNERIATEVGVFSDRSGANAAVARLEEVAIPPEDIGVIADPRKAREVVGTRARQLVVPMALIGAVAGVMLLVLANPAQGGVKFDPAFLAVWVLVGVAGGILVGALAGKLVPRKDPDRYVERVERGDILVTVKVTPDERSRVRRLLAAAGAVNLREEPTGEAP